MTRAGLPENVTEEGAKAVIAAQEAKRAVRSAPPTSPPWSAGRRLAACGVARLPRERVRVDIMIDVRDAMGANRLNTAAERVRPLLEEVSGGRALMAILSNEARDRDARARYALPFAAWRAGLPAGMDGAGGGPQDRRCLAIAQEDPSRAVTHNKGIMNGICSLALATMNDTRAVEAAAHAWAAPRRGPTAASPRTGRRRDPAGALSSCPFPWPRRGGSVDFHPAARASLRILGYPDGPGLARIAAAVGLAQNLAALLALVTHGIQKGTCAHALPGWRGARARGEPRCARVADRLSERPTRTRRRARAPAARLRRGAP